MNINTDIDILLAKYFSGEASVNELTMLDDWLAESNQNQAYFDEMTLAFEKAVQPTPPPKVNTAKAWDKFEQYMQQAVPTELHSTKKPPLKIKRYIPIAAAIAVLVALAITLFTNNKDSDHAIHIAAAQNAVEHIMPDKSVIVLSENSSITYDKDYGTTEKSLSLTGKASFDVGEESSSMIVSVGETFIKDIGTIFTVDGYADNQYISVSVESGIVLFYTISDSGLNLYEGETGYFNKTTKQFSKHVDGKEVGFDQIVFNGTPLYKVIERLSQQFDISIALATNSIAHKQLTVSFSRDENVEYMLQVIAETLRLTIQLRNGTYVLSPL